MRVTIFGPGNMGRALATRLLAGGHSVTLVGRDPDTAERLAAELVDAPTTGAAEVGVASSADAGLAEAEAVIMATPFSSSLEIARQHGARLTGKVLVDVSIPMNEGYDGLLTEGGPSAAESIAAELPAGSRLVKAFNTCFSGTLLNGEIAGQALDVFIAGDDHGANRVVAELAMSGGMRPIVVGGLARARQLEGMGFLGIAIQPLMGSGFMSGWKLLLPGASPPEAKRGFPRNAVIGVFEETAAVGGTVRALIEAGIPESAIHTMFGAEARRRIEEAWDVRDFLNEFMALGYEQTHTERHIRELEAGHALVLVDVANERLAGRVGETMAAEGGRFVNYYSRWTSRNIVP